MSIEFTYVKREIKFLRLWKCKNWTFKIYGITHPARLMPKDNSLLIKAGLELTQQLINKVDRNEHYGAGFLIIHQGLSANFLLVDWWTDENVLHHDLYISKLDAPLDFVNINLSGWMACVWEMRVQSFESNAWVSHVLDVSSPDFDAYFRQQLNGTF